MSVDFDPVRLRPNRRRIDPVVVGIVVVVVGIAAAIVKPWEGGRQGIAIAPSPPAPAAAATQAIRPAPVGIVPQPVPPPGPPPPTWSDMAPALVDHAAWGIAAMVAGPPPASDAPPATGFVELWSPAVSESGGGDRAFLARDQQSIVALGVTVPAGAGAADARIWRIHDDDRLEWIDAHLVGGRGPAGTLLLIQPPSAGLAYTSWNGGHYRIDVLTDDGIHRIALDIAGRFGNVPGPDPWPPALADLVAARKGDPTVTRQGPFATVDGVSVDLPATPGPPLDEAGEWRAALASSGSPSAAPTVAVAHLPRATGLGVMFTEHAVIDSATVKRLAPDGLIDAGPAFGGVSSLHGRTPYLVFIPTGGAAWAPGVYAITAAWTDPAGAHAGTWYVELRPGSPVGGPAAVSGPETGG
ncbi:MAG TPA: hypothetical protein VGQ31_05860 [Candidatus Limnocylindrales bacterium]|nr:hypothetical protein [Candidatus Limnocylindrales bacterium]